MERNIFLTVLIGSLLAVAIALMIPGRTVDEDPKLPWKIEVDAEGNSTVFGLTLGQSTLSEARQILSDEGEIDLLVSEEGNKTVEAFFNGIFLSGLKADFVMTLDLDKDAVEGMSKRGVRISTLESGTKKTDLSQADLALAAKTPIMHITYLPKTDLDEERIRSLFGEAERIIKEPQSGISHWLYPSRGLDIAIDPNRKEVFQYVKPADFQMILTPLEEMVRHAKSNPDP
jgi:hypothetical protein